MRPLSDEASSGHPQGSDVVSGPPEPHRLRADHGPGSRGTRPVARSTACPAAWPEHRPRGGRPPRRRAPARPRGAALARPATAARRDVTYAELRGGDQPLRQRAARPRRRAGRPGLHACSAGSPSSTSAALGTLKHARVVLPAVLGVRARADPPAARARATRAVLVTTPALYRRKVAPSATRCPSLRHVLSSATTSPTGPRHLGPRRPLAGRVRDRSRSSRPTPEDLALLHFTSGTTGTPEGRGARPRGGRRPPRHRPARRSTCTPTTSSGARPIPAGSRARPTGSSPRSPTA